MQKLILTVGLPWAGKSTWARQQGCPVVNTDSIRLALTGQRYMEEIEDYVWATAFTMVRALFIAGHNKVIFDATNNTKKRRDLWFKRFVSAEICVELKIFKASASECIAGAREGGYDHLIPVIKRMDAASDWRGITSKISKTLIQGSVPILSKEDLAKLWTNKYEWHNRVETCKCHACKLFAVLAARDKQIAEPESASHSKSVRTVNAVSAHQCGCREGRGHYER